jgi:hypothetical protein
MATEDYLTPEQRQIAEDVATVTMFFKTIILNGMREEMSPKLILENIWMQCEEYLRDTDINVKYPQGYPIDYDEHDLNE